MSRKTAQKSQSQAFIAKAKELGIDVDETEFEANLRRIAKARPQPAQKPKKKAPDE